MGRARCQAGLVRTNRQPRSGPPISVSLPSVSAHPLACYWHTVSEWKDVDEPRGTAGAWLCPGAGCVDTPTATPAGGAWFPGWDSLSSTPGSQDVGCSKESGLGPLGKGSTAGLSLP